MTADMTAYTVLIIGGDSNIGRAVGVELEKSGSNVIFTSRRKKSASRNSFYLDLSKPLTQWDPPKVDACLLAGAVTSLNYCRQQPQYCQQVNVHAAISVAEKLNNNGAYVLFLSSNQVFDGKAAKVQDSAAVNPMTLYGKHKVQVETQLLKWDNASGILRLSKVLDSNNALLNLWYSSLLKGQNVQAFNNYFMAPVSMQYASKAIVWVLQSRLPGITHLSGDKDLSYFDAAQILAKEMGKIHLVEAASAEQTAMLEHIPRHTTMDCSRLEKFFKQSIPTSLDTVQDTIHRLLA